MKISSTLMAAASVVGLAALAAPASAQLAPGFNTGLISANDDGSSSTITLPFAVNFYRTTYNSLYVNNNGNLTFTGPLSTYTPSGLGSNYSVGLPIIAPFFADVDTTGSGSALTTYGTGTYNGYAAFGATWNGVGYYQSHTDKLDSFQALLVNRSDTGAGNFDIVFNYGSIQWETGDASHGSNGLGGTSAAAGFNAGQSGNPAGTFYQLAGSLQNGAFINGGPDALNGEQFTFAVRNGSAVLVPPVAGAAPEPGTWAMMITGFGLAGTMLRRRKTTTRVAFAA